MPIETNGASQELLDLLMFDKVQAGVIPEDSFTSMLQACQENPSFVTVLTELKKTGEPQFQALLLLGPGGLVNLVGTLAQNKVVTRSEITKECKIKTGPKRQPVWYKEIGKEIIAAAHAFMQEQYLNNLEANREKWGDVVPDSFDEMLRASGKSNLTSTVDSWEHPQTGRKCALALLYRIDYNTPSRNGVKEAEKNAAAAASENGATATAG